MFLALKIVGALYLLWLAIDAVRNGSSLNVARPTGRSASRSGRRWRWGSPSISTNPKVVLFFLTFLPQFVDAHDPHAAGKLLFLGIYFVVLDLSRWPCC